MTNHDELTNHSGAPWCQLLQLSVEIRPTVAVISSSSLLVEYLFMNTGLDCSIVNFFISNYLYLLFCVHIIKFKLLLPNL